MQVMNQGTKLSFLINTLFLFCSMHLRENKKSVLRLLKLPVTKQYLAVNRKELNLKKKTVPCTRSKTAVKAVMLKRLSDTLPCRTILKSTQRHTAAGAKKKSSKESLTAKRHRLKRIRATAFFKLI